jgi:hypothetical protein
VDLLYQGVVDGKISLERWVEVCSTTPARMFGMYGQKGVIAPGADGDVVVYDPNGHTSIEMPTAGTGKAHHMNMDYSAYEGVEIDGHVDRVISRGDSAVRTTHGAPTTLNALRESIPVIRELANSRPAQYNGATVRFPWSRGSSLDIGVALTAPSP